MMDMMVPGTVLREWLTAAGKEAKSGVDGVRNREVPRHIHLTFSESGPGCAKAPNIAGGFAQQLEAP